MKSIEWSPASGEDAGKKFVITRMPAFAADKWARHLSKAVIQSTNKMSDAMLDQAVRKAMEEGILGIASMSMTIFANVDDEACDKAFDQLLQCVKIKRGKSELASPLLEADISDPQTLTDLRSEAFKLHVGFFKAAIFQSSPLAAALISAVAPEKQPPR
ncbi:phage tail assembly chaperone [Gluconobacter oxydans]|uniref:phage tail assembly chaperone n=1 Tax=Gluconobacter oxydans TaxID=442 RepID=UPI0039EA0AAC